MMGVYIRSDSPYYWVCLPRLGQRPLRLSTNIPIAGATPAQEKEHRRLADAAYASMMGDLARERFELPGARTPQPITFQTYADWYETHHTVQHRGAIRERQLLTQLRRFFGTLPLIECGPMRAQEYVTRRMHRNGVAAGTVAREIGLIKTMLNHAVGEHLDYNPLAGFKPPRVVVLPKRTMTAAEEPLFLEALRDDELRDMYLVGVGTLFRQGNLLSLQRRHVLGTHIQLSDSKTGPYTVPLTGPTPLQTRAAQVLQRRQPKHAHDYLFPRWQAHFAQYKTPNEGRVKFLRTVRPAVEAAGLPWGLPHGGVDWHTLTRATGATRMLREFHIDIRTVQLIGHWKSLDQMAKYLGVDDVLFGMVTHADGSDAHAPIT